MSAKLANVIRSDLATLQRTTFGARVAIPAVLLKTLQPFARRHAVALFSIPIIGAGLLSIPILAASAAFGVAGLAG